MKRILRWLAVLAFAAGGWASMAKADGMVVYPIGKPVYEIGQKAVIVHDGKRETLTVSTTFKGNASDFAWIIPVPSKPEVVQAKDELFTALDDYTKPKYQENIPVPMVGIGSSNYDTVKAPGVTIIETKKIDIYDVTVLEATEGKALRTWLTEHGYEYPVNRDYLLQYYIDKKWYFVAAKVTTGALGYATYGLSNGHATPLSISFDWPTIIYPLKISGKGSMNVETSKVAAFGFEQGTEGWSGGIVTADEHWQGSKSYAVSVVPRLPTTQPTTTGKQFFASRQMVGLDRGSTYTLSGYVKVKGVMLGKLDIQVFDGKEYNNVSLGDVSEYNEWKQFSVPFMWQGDYGNIYLNSAILSGQGTVNWDGIQVEKGSVVSNFLEERIPENGQSSDYMVGTQNTGIVLYVFAKNKQTVPGFTTDYAGNVPAKDIEKLALNDDGTPWMKINKKMYLTKLSRSMTQAQMLDDLIIRDADNNDVIGGAKEAWDGLGKPGLILAVPLVVELCAVYYFWYSRSKRKTEVKP